MKLIRKVCLYFQDGKSDKVYEVDLCDLGSGSGAARYVVNFRYGRRGKTLREGTKTVDPVTFDEANEIFTSVVVSKTNKGYQSEHESGAAPVALRDVSLASTNDNAAIDKRAQILLDRLARAKLKAIDSGEVKRTVWRVGELRLRSAAATICTLIFSADDVLDYCIAWSLGRCGDASVLPSLVEIQRRYGLNYVGRMARESLVTLAADDEKQRVYDEILSSLPVSLADAISSTDPKRIFSSLEVLIQTMGPQLSNLLSNIYCLSRDNSPVREALIMILGQVPLKPDTFRGVRQIFKHAEFRCDGAVFGLLNYRFEKQHQYFNRNWNRSAFSPKVRRYLDIEKEFAKEDTAFAFSNRTRDYLRRRAWRSIKRLGELGNAKYAEMAADMLLPVKDSDASIKNSSRFYDYHQGRLITRNYHPYAGFLAFNFIINRHNPRIRLGQSRKAWQIDEDVAETPGFRCEAFPELWDRHPQQLLRLLNLSECEAVHLFAERAIRANTTFLNSLDIDSIVRLLRKPYQNTANLGLDLAKTKISAGHITHDLIAALMEGFCETARQLARDIISANSQWILEYPQLMFSAICSEYSDNRLWMRRFATEMVLDESVLQSLIARLISQVITFGKDETRYRPLIDDIAWMIVNVYARQVRMLGVAVIDDLLSESAESVQILAARLLINHSFDVQQLPPALLRKVMESPYAEVRALGVQLFGQLPDEILLQQPAFVIALAVSRDAQVRQAARPIISRLANRNHDFAEHSLQKLMGYLFLAESVEGLHADILGLINKELSHVLNELDQATTWRLLQSRSKAAQRLGAELMNRFRHTDFSVRQLARLAGHSILQVREWALLEYKNNVERIKLHAQDALMILDNPWDDVREFAFTYFSEHFDASDWNADLLIGICDSVRNDVQNFGRDLINRFFEENEGANYLLKLSQHPSRNVQLFASNYLKQYAAGNVEFLQALRLYFVTVLSQVNSARAAKSRITRFLGDEALKSEAAAALVSEIFSRQSVTAAIIDKSACIEILLKIQQRYPHLPSPLQLIQTSSRGSAVAASQAV